MESDHNWFELDADWAAHAVDNGLHLPDKGDVCKIEAIMPAVLDVTKGREDQLISQRVWTNKHPLSSIGYEFLEFTVRGPNGNEIPVKASWPRQDQKRNQAGQGQDSPLPVLFVTHGGGFIQGTHVSEEQWLLWPLYDRQELIIVSIEYRLAPEHRFPAWIDDSWYVLTQMFAHPSSFISSEDILLDVDSVILAGSSTGACISAVLSQRCRDAGIVHKGVILNVPVLCDYRHFPYSDFRNLNKNHILSYEQCTKTVLPSSVMKAVWDLAVPSTSLGSDPHVSPLLGRLESLPAHVIFVAGHDPVRDEGIFYANKLRKADVPIDLRVYPGVPHTFAEIHELMSTKKFWKEMNECVEKLLRTV